MYDLRSIACILGGVSHKIFCFWGRSILAVSRGE